MFQERNQMRHSFLVSILVSFFTVSGVACSSSGSGDDHSNSQSTNSPTTNSDETDSGMNTTTDGSTEDAGTATDAAPKTPTNQAECVAACEAKYPDAATKSKLIDACFTGKCAADCDGVAYTGKLYQPDVDGGSDCTTKAKSDPIAVASVACANCVATLCCKEWTDVFATDSGRALNACSVACYTQFAK